MPRIDRGVTIQDSLHLSAASGRTGFVMPTNHSPQHSGPRTTSGYVHGFTAQEEERLRRQARIIEHRIHGALPFHRSQELLEVGCGVGAQTEILLRYFPDLHVLGLDASPANLEAAKRHLSQQTWAEGRYELVQGDASRLSVEGRTFDAAYLCWVLEHVADPALVLSEVRRVLRPGAQVVCNEVWNSSFFLSPYSPHTMSYWTAFNDRQLDLGGDPFVGAKLGNLLQRVGFHDIKTEVRTVHLDNRAPRERAEFIGFWTDLLLSGSSGLLESSLVSEDTVEGMKAELASVAHDPDAVFLYSFVQAQARVG